MAEIYLSQFSEFDNYPIEFKEVNPEDFHQPFVVEEKIIISPNTKGYINDDLQSNILLDNKNTVVINAAVGQGKSYGIIQTVKKYYDKMKNGEDKYLIFVASPFVSLVKQYCEDIHKDADIPEEEIFNYGVLRGRGLEDQYMDKPIQVVTANTLLGNHGEDSFKSSDVKIDYINNLIKHSEKNELKVVFIFDEIHDAYQNFENKFIYNLWKWKHLLLKNYVISATFNEASKIVIEFLAELTDFKIKIIESKRTRFPEKQSELFLYYSNSHYFKEDTSEIVKVVKNLVKKNKNIDILCHSKTLAKSIADKKTEIGSVLHKKFGEVKLCVSENVSNSRMENKEPKNQFTNYIDKDNTSKGYQCNVGTNFKTGVSIKKENHAFVIIFPPRSTRLPFKNLYGIFSNGMNDVVQALARQRTKGEIHIIMPTPNKFNFDSLKDSSMTSSQKEAFAKLYKEVENKNEEEDKVWYHSISSQKKLLKRFYVKELYLNVRNQVEEVNQLERNGLISINYPIFKEFIFTDGEKYLASNYLLFGADLSAYVTYCAFTNQFINCRLAILDSADVLFFETGKIRKQLLNLYTNCYGTSHFDSSNLYTFGVFIRLSKDFLFDNFTLKLSKQNTNGTLNWRTITKWKDKNFEQQFLGFCIEVYYGKDYLANNPSQRFQDAEVSLRYYLLNGISGSGFPFYPNSRPFEFNEETKELVNSPELLSLPKVGIERFYEILKYFRSHFEAKILTHSTNTTNYTYLLNNHPNDFFTNEDSSLIDELYSLISNDLYLDNKVFTFKSKLINNPSSTKEKNFYKTFMALFFNYDKGNKRLPFGDRLYIKKNVRVVEQITNGKIVELYREEGLNMEFYKGELIPIPNFNLEV